MLIGQVAFASWAGFSNCVASSPSTAASRAVTAVYRLLLAELGLTYPRYLVLVVLWNESTVTVKDLGDLLHLDSGRELGPRTRYVQASIQAAIGLTDEQAAALQKTLRSLAASATSYRPAVPVT